jgi:hypothetical protein
MYAYVFKYNPNHDKEGRFAARNSGEVREAMAQAAEADRNTTAQRRPTAAEAAPTAVAERYFQSAHDAAPTSIAARYAEENSNLADLFGMRKRK